jgi:hypothetical protein
VGAERRRPPTCFIGLIEGTLCLNTVGGVSDTFPAPQDSICQWPKTPYGGALFAYADPIRYEVLQQSFALSTHSGKDNVSVAAS